MDTPNRACANGATGKERQEMKWSDAISREIVAYISGLSNKQLAIQMLKAKHGGNMRYMAKLVAEHEQRKAKQ